MTDSPDGSLYAALVAFFEAENWPAALAEDQALLSLPYQGQNGQWLCYAQAREAEQQFIFYSVCPVNVPAARRMAVAEFVTRANYGLVIGNFELDLDDGELRYKTALDVEGDAISLALIRQCVYPNVLMMDLYLPALMRVVYGQATPVEALEKVFAEEVAGE